MKIKLVYILSDFRGWILEAIAQESADSLNLDIKIIFIPTRWKDLLRIRDLLNFLRYRNRNELSLFINQSTYFRALKFKLIRTKPENCRVYYTHKQIERDEFIEAKELFNVEKILTNNAYDMHRLINLGVDTSRVEVIYGAIDHQIYFPAKKRLEKNYLIPYIIIVGNCKERKNPKLIYEVVCKMKKIKFIIHGEGWEKYFYRNALAIPDNLKLLNFDKKQNPELMRNAHVYLSLAYLEGGPYTTLEALASGTPVVATNTGFNSDFLNSTNGVLLPINTNVFQVEAAIIAALALKKKVSSMDLLNGQFTWHQLALKLYG